MATEQIAIELRIKNQQLSNDLRRTEREINSLRRSMNAVGNEGSTSLNRLETSAKKTQQSLASMNTVLRAVAIVSATQAIAGQIKSLVDYVSAIQSANNQLRSVTDTQAEFNRMQQATLQIAQEVGTAYTDTAVTVSRLARAMEEFGGTQDQALIVTDSLNKAMLLTGTTGAEATSTLIQFSQALQSGLLQGDELRSLRENAPAVIKAIAEEMKIPVSAIKEAGKEGKITADIITKALVKANADLTKEMEKMPLTLDRALTQTSNKFAEFLSTSDEFNSASKDIAENVAGLGDLFVTLAEDVSSSNSEFSAGTQEITGMNSWLDVLGETIKGTIRFFYTLGKVVKVVFDTIVNLFTAAGQVIARFGESLGRTLSGVYDVITGIFTFDPEQVLRGVSTLSTSWKGTLTDMMASSQGFFDSTKADFTDFFEDVDTIFSDRAPVVKVKLDGTGDLTAPTVTDKGEAEKKKDIDYLKQYQSALESLKQTMVGMQPPAQQAIAEFDAVGVKIDELRVLALKAGVAIDEGFIAKLQELATQKVEKTLEDLQTAWTDLSVALDEQGVKLKDNNDLWASFVRTGLAAGKTMDEITAAFKKFNEDIKGNEQAKELKQLVEGIKESFADAVLSIVDGSATAGEALRALIKDVLGLIAKMLILKAIEAGGAALGIPGFGTEGVSGQSSPQINVFNYGAQAGGVQTRGNASGGVDIIIGQLTQAITRGGNPLDAALRRSYGLGRIGA